MCGFSGSHNPFVDFGLSGQGSFSIFFISPLAAASLIVALFLLISPLIPWLGKRRREIPTEEVFIAGFIF